MIFSLIGTFITTAPVLWWIYKTPLSAKPRRETADCGQDELMTSPSAQENNSIDNSFQLDAAYSLRSMLDQFQAKYEEVRE